MSDASLNLEFPGGLDFDGGTEGHLEVASVILGEALLEGLLEERGVERVTHHHVAASRVYTGFHLVNACQWGE